MVEWAKVVERFWREESRGRSLRGFALKPNLLKDLHIIKVIYLFILKWMRGCVEKVRKCDFEGQAEEVAGRGSMLMAGRPGIKAASRARV